VESESYAAIVVRPAPITATALAARSRLLIAILTPCLFAHSPGGARAGDSPPEVRDAATAFYSAVLAGSRGGVPGEQDRERLAPHLSATLAELLAEADATERGYRDATRGEVPPLVEGDLFSSLFEGPTAFAVSSCATEDGSASCAVELRYEPPGDAAKTHWRDQVRLVKSDRGWRVDDVVYGGDWEFMHKGTLRTVLAGVIRDGRAETAAARKEGLLLGGWIYVTGETEFEQIAFAVEDGRHVFRSWLHERPEVVGDWSRDGDTVTIRGSDGSTWKLAISKLDESTLEIRFEGKAEPASFRRPRSPSPEPKLALPAVR
jgi:hypothetical protein